MARRVVEDMVVKGGKRGASKTAPREPSPFLQTLQKDLQKESRTRQDMSRKEPLRPPLPPQEPPFYPPLSSEGLPHKRDFFFKKWYAFIILLIIMGGAFIFFSSRPLVVISVTPKTELKEINLVVEASKDGVDTDIAYTPLEEVEETTFTLPSTGAKDIDRRAQGQIIIFNSYSTAAQPLAARTRFQTPEGKIFRITSSVRVPGYTTKAGKIVPGTIEVVAYADESGEDYNVGYADFTLPGFLNKPQHTKIIARSKTEMAGGFSGKMKLYDETLLLKEKTSREAALMESLTKKVQAKIPADSTLFSKALSYSYSYDVDNHVAANSAADAPVTVKVTGTARGMLLKTADIYALLAKNVYPEETASIEVKDLSAITFALSAENALSGKAVDVISFTLKGKPLFVWTVSKTAIQKALAGSPKDSASYTALFKSKFPTILAANVENFRPFWMRHFPNDPSKIVIEELIPSPK